MSLCLLPVHPGRCYLGATSHWTGPVSPSECPHRPVVPAEAAQTAACVLRTLATVTTIPATGAPAYCLQQHCCPSKETKHRGHTFGLSGKCFFAPNIGVSNCLFGSLNIVFALNFGGKMAFSWQQIFCPAEAPVIGAPGRWAHTGANTWNYAEDSAVRTHFRQHSTLATVFPVSEGPCLFQSC